MRPHDHLTNYQLVAHTAELRHEDAELRWQAFCRQCERIVGERPRPDACEHNQTGFNGKERCDHRSSP